MLPAEQTTQSTDGISTFTLRRLFTHVHLPCLECLDQLYDLATHQQPHSGHFFDAAISAVQFSYKSKYEYYSSSSV